MERAVIQTRHPEAMPRKLSPMRNYKANPDNSRSMRANAGFTLMELMIVVGIVAILATLAIPAYQTSILRSNRSIAKTRLMDVVTQQTRYYIDNRAYGVLTDLGYATDTIGFNSDNTTAAGAGTYDLSVSAANATTYTIQAVATNQQLADTACLTLTINQAGVKSPISCW